MIRIGVDFGGTKIEAAALDAEGRFLARVRRPNPGRYDDALGAVRELVAETEAMAGAVVDRVGVGAPGSLSPVTGLMRNANSVWLNGRPFARDLDAVLGRPVRLENDANCLALSEAVDGAAAGAAVVFAAILGTGVGGGLVVDGRLISGRNGVAGEWGHTPLPSPAADEAPPSACWCGRLNCLETWISGSALVADYVRGSGPRLSGPEIVEAARAGDAAALAALTRWRGRAARAFAAVVNLLDPDVIVLGGGLSNVPELYAPLPQLIASLVFSDAFTTPIMPPLHGDSSGVRGAAWLWPL